MSIDKASERGYARDPQLQQEFAQAAEHLRQADGYVDPANPQQGLQLRADLALESGVKLSVLLTQFAATQACDTALSVGIRALHTMTGEWNRYSIDQVTAARTIFVDRAGPTATQFGLTPAQQDQLFRNGVTAATQFIIEMARAGGVPRTAQQAQQLAKARATSAGGMAVAPASGPG